MMSNNDNNQRQRRAISGASVVVGAVGVLVGLAAAEHAQAQQENRESLVEGVGRWLRENVLDSPSTATGRGAGPSNSAMRAIPRRLTRSEVNTLPVRRITDANNVHGQSESTAETTDHNEKAFCVVCREPYVNGDVLLRLPCFHEFHSECIRDYLETSESPLCPICRHPVTIS